MKKIGYLLSFIKKIIFLLLGLLMLLTILGIDVDVFALSNVGWANDFNIDVSAGYSYRNAQGVSSGPLAFNNVPNSTEPYADIHSYLSANTNFYNGFLFGITDTFNQNYIYSITFFACTTNFYLPDASYNLIIGEYDEVFNMSATYNSYRRTHARMNKQPFSWQSTDYNSCAKFNYLFTAQKNAPWIGLFFKRNTSNVNTYFDVYRIDIDIVGYDGNEIVNSLVGANETLKQDIIDNQDKNSQEQIENENKNHQETMNTITDDSPPENDSTNNFVSGSAGWLPAGPMDTILNLPLTLMNNLLDALNHKCNPISVPLPYVDTNFIMVCPGDLVKQINGVGSFMNFIGIIASAYMLYAYLLHLYEWTDKVSRLENMKVPGYYEEP